MKLRYLFMCCSTLSVFLKGETLSINQESSGRLNIIFQNNSIEDVLVSIRHVPLDPLPKYLVKIGEWRRFTPQQLTSSEHPLHIILRGSAAGTLHYVLALRGNPNLGAIPACRAYGSLELMRGDEVIQSIGASALETGIMLKYDEYYELTVEPIKGHGRTHRSDPDNGKKTTTQTCGSRRKNGCRSCSN